MDSLEIALKSHREGDLSRAEAIYISLLEADPEQPEAIHYLGVLLHQKGRSAEAFELVHKSLQLAPFRAEWHNDLGNMLVETGFLHQAAEAFLNALEIDAVNPALWNNLGSTLEKLKQCGDAEAAYGKAIELDPQFVDALNNMGNLLASLGREIEAAQHYCKAYVIGPHEGKPKSMLGIAHYKLGQIDRAAEIYRQWMKEEPENPVPRHLYASCSGLDVPERASDAYIEKTFDEFSENFDVKMEQIAYRGHELVLGALSSRMRPEGKLIGLDAGCGTGLCGPLVRPYLSRLVGVDLSSGMLEAARRREVYDELVRMELTSYLDNHPGAFDLIVSSDTLSYFGALFEVLGGMRRALKSGGLLIFTVEEAQDGHYRINPHGRYSHGRSYLREALGKCGFEGPAFETGVMRFEFGREVSSLLVSARARN